MYRATPLLALSALCAAFGQTGGDTAASSRAFDVASVRPHEGAIPRSGGHISVSGPRLTIEIYSLLGLLTYAYNVKPYQIPGAASLDHTFYDIVAQAADGRTRTKDEFRPMLQALLADRFKLDAHLEMKEMPVYALVVGKNGPKVKESAPDAALPAHSGAVDGRNVVAVIVANATMENLADRIRDNAGLDRPVVDRTGLAGTYQIDLAYTPPNRMRGDPEDIDIFLAVQAQLGLKLEAQKAMVQMLIIDHVEKPTGND